MIGLPNEIVNRYDGNILNTVSSLVKSILFYPWGSLWYLLALMVSVFILSKFYNKKMYYEPIFIGGFLYAFALISNSYYYVIQNIPLINKFVLKYMELFISSRNGIFVGILYISIGVLLAKLINENKLFKLSTNVFLFGLSFIFLFIEVYILKFNIAYEDHSLFIIMPLLISLLIIILIQLKNKKNFKNLRFYSIGTYLMHRPILALLNRYCAFNNTIHTFISVLAIAFILCFILSKINIKFIKKIMLQ